MQDAERGGAEFEGASEAWAAAFERAAPQLAELLVCAVPFGLDAVPDGDPDVGIDDQAGVLAHDVEVAAGEGGFDVGEEVMEEGTGAEVGLEALDGTGVEGGEAGAGTIPAGEVEAGLGP